MEAAFCSGRLHASWQGFTYLYCSGDPRCRRLSQLQSLNMSEVAIEILSRYPRNFLEKMRFLQALHCDNPVYHADKTACIEWGNHVICCREQVRHINICKHCAMRLSRFQNRMMCLVHVDTSNWFVETMQVSSPKHYSTASSSSAGWAMGILLVRPSQAVEHPQKEPSDF